MNYPKLLILTFILTCIITGCSNKYSEAPILILASEDGFGTYTGEILKAEGFNEFKISSLKEKNLTKSYLKLFDVVILSASVLESGQKELLAAYVMHGGNLIAFRPDTSLSGLLGIIPLGENISEGYIRIDTSTLYGNGLTARAMQFHGQADLYEARNARTIAAMFTGNASKEGFPGVVCNDFGKGLTVAFLYNLPASIVLTRQGNPLLAGIEKDSIPGLRAMDLFTDGWVDTSLNTINQADEQMALLSHCIENLTALSKPLPRLWYFPDTLKCLVTLTNDGEYKAEEDFETQFMDVDSMDAKMSLYVMESDKVSREWVDKWTASGFEISGHPDDTREAGNPDWHNMDSVMKAKIKEIDGKYGLTMRTNVNHWFVWCGKDSADIPEFAAQAEIEARHGIQLDVNYAHYDNFSCQEHFLGPMGICQGNFTGSGLIMKFSGSSGNILDIYQHLNNVYDQQYNENHDPEGFYDCFKGLMDRSLNNEVYSFISVKSHNDEYYFSRNPLMKMITYAKENGIPVWTALKLLEFIRMRDEASFKDIIWADNNLSFNLSSSLGHTSGLTFMVPFSKGNVRIQNIIKNNKEVPFIVRSVKGQEYALVTVDPGNEYSFMVNYGN